MSASQSQPLGRGERAATSGSELSGLTVNPPISRHWMIISNLKHVRDHCLRRADDHARDLARDESK